MSRTDSEVTLEDLEAYERVTIEYVLAKSPRLAKLSIFALCEMYHDWSEDTYSAGWLGHSPSVTDSFIEWATRDMPCPARAWEKP